MLVSCFCSLQALESSWCKIYYDVWKSYFWLTQRKSYSDRLSFDKVIVASQASRFYEPRVIRSLYNIDYKRIVAVAPVTVSYSLDDALLRQLRMPRLWLMSVKWHCPVIHAHAFCMYDELACNVHFKVAFDSYRYWENGSRCWGWHWRYAMFWRFSNNVKRTSGSYR